ncbi:MAG: glycosyl transferase [Alphaproteobacteria bacterium]|nr:MAG: glycosyl transferase [Alphaproteobacteria bacterium]
MKILHIIAGASQGGAETFCLDAIKSLHSQSVDQYVLCRPHSHFVEALNERDIEHSSLSFNRFKKHAEKKIIAATIESYKPDVVHCWMNRASSFMPANINAATLGWFGGYYNLKNYKNCDFYMGVTKDIVRHIIDKTNKPHRSFLVHTFGTLEKDKPVKRSDFNIPDDAKVVLLLSRMHWKKGIDTLLKAALQIEDTYFLLAGDGPDLNKYRKLSQKLGLDNRVRFLGWRNDRAALLNIADVCVLPSRYEPFGTVIAEAWYAKTALVATKAAGAKQYVTHDVDGLLCEIDDSDTLALHIKSVLTDNKKKDTLIANGYKTYESLFSKDVVTAELIRAYQHIIQTRNAKQIYVNPNEYVTPNSVKNSLNQAVSVLDKENVDLESVCKVANSYLSMCEDKSLHSDAAYIQASGLYNFLKTTLFRPRVEILSEAEINTILSSEKCIRSCSLYEQFTKQYIKK